MLYRLNAKLRGLAKTSCAVGLDWTRLAGRVGARRGLENAPLVIGYHRVVEDFHRSERNSISPMLVSTRTLEMQLDWIGKRYRFVSLDELATTMKNGGSDGRPVAAGTFDDGYRDVYDNAHPILRRKGIPYAVFVVTDLVSSGGVPAHDEIFLLLSAWRGQNRESGPNNWRDLVATLGLPTEQAQGMIGRLEGVGNLRIATRAVLEELRQPDMRRFIEAMKNAVTLESDVRREFRSLSWDMLRRMVAEGATAGSHTKSHALLPHENADVIREEVEGSRRRLQDELGVPITHFAYPDGRFDSRVIEALARAGYQTAYTICRHRDPNHPLLTVPRTMLWENTCMNSSGQFSPAILNCQINGIFNPADKCRLQHWA
jgi:peptidoglycan/xylan/chitin deacetylase (PgdA/CDA1 family)